MKRILLCTAASVMLLTGCKAEQVQDKNYVRAMAATGTGGYAAAFSFYDESADAFSVSGETLEKLREKAEVSLGKTLFTGHTELIILGDCNYTEILTYFLKEWKVSPSCLVVYGGPYSAYWVKSPDTEALANSVRRAVEQGKVPECDIITVLGGLLSDEKSAAVAMLDDTDICGSYTLESE